jgi:hypothetical protein
MESLSKLAFLEAAHEASGVAGLRKQVKMMVLLGLV